MASDQATATAQPAIAVTASGVTNNHKRNRQHETYCRHEEDRVECCCHNGHSSLPSQEEGGGDAGGGGGGGGGQEEETSYHHRLPPHGPKKPRGEQSPPPSATAATKTAVSSAPADTTTVTSAANATTVIDDDSDSDYDDLEDDFAVPTDMDDYLDDEDCPYDVVDSDDQSTTSTQTSTGSVGSNTPSLVGENLESFSLGEGEKAGAQTARSKQRAMVGGPLVRNTEPPLRRSLFSHVPPAINFVHHNEVPEVTLPTELRKNLRWKNSTITPAVVKKVIMNSGFRLMRRNCTEWGGTWGKHMKSPMFKESLGESQKINHFPGTFNIGRKDRLWKNYQKLRLKFGKTEFNFLPRTFCLPADTKVLRKAWEKRGVKAKWIIKPPALARGTGIKVVNKWSQIPKSCPLIVQRYIAKPHLINSSKYDLRIYVLVTSVQPLRIYLYDEGLVRFASNKYEPDNSTLGDVFMHLTNYSINKNSQSYVPNEESDSRQGHKWTLGSLWQHFAEQGVDTKCVWERIKDLVIKTLVSAEDSISGLIKNNLASHYCGYELFGFDVLLDCDLKPWLIEVNISPSLHSASSLDLDVKSPLATEIFNLARFHVPNKISAKSQREILRKLNMDDLKAQLCLDPRLYTKDVSKADRQKQNNVLRLIGGADGVAERGINRNDYLEQILDRLTPDDVRCLIRAEDELTQMTHFNRIFPTQDTFRYFKYFQEPRYHNLLLDAWEFKYGDCRSAGIDRLEQLCIEKVHLRVPTVNNTSNESAVFKAPTGTRKTATTTTTATVAATNDNAKDKEGNKPLKKLGFVAKPLHVKCNYGLTQSASASSISSSSSSTSSSGHKLSKSRSFACAGDTGVRRASSTSSSPEPMSIGEDFSSNNASEGELESLSKPSSPAAADADAPKSPSPAHAPTPTTPCPVTQNALNPQQKQQLEQPLT